MILIKKMVRRHAVLALRPANKVVIDRIDSAFNRLVCGKWSSTFDENIRNDPIRIDTRIF